MNVLLTVPRGYAVCSTLYFTVLLDSGHRSDSNEVPWAGVSAELNVRLPDGDTQPAAYQAVTAGLSAFSALPHLCFFSSAALSPALQLLLSNSCIATPALQLLLCTSSCVGKEKT